MTSKILITLRILKITKIHHTFNLFHHRNIIHRIEIIIYDINKWPIYNNEHVNRVKLKIKKKRNKD